MRIIARLAWSTFPDAIQAELLTGFWGRFALRFVPCCFLLSGIREPSLIVYRTRRGALQRRGAVQPNPGGAFVYTGETPSDVELLDVVPHAIAKQRTASSAGYLSEDLSPRPVTSYRSANRWPSAY